MSACTTRRVQSCIVCLVRMQRWGGSRRALSHPVKLTDNVFDLAVSQDIEHLLATVVLNDCVCVGDFQRRNLKWSLHWQSAAPTVTQNVYSGPPRRISADSDAKSFALPSLPFLRATCREKRKKVACARSSKKSRLEDDRSPYIWCRAVLNVATTISRRDRERWLAVILGVWFRMVG